MPQVPGQGSTHLLFKHACVNGHSALTTHSGLQLGGFPIKPNWHEHTAISLLTLHKLFGPHGDGLHGCLGVKSLSIILHSVNGSPSYPGKQLHVGM